MLKIEAVSKAFVESPASITDTRSLALWNINLTVSEREFLCLLGPSGCGKSTLLNIIAGFEAPTEGRVLLEEKPIIGPGRDRVLLFQNETASLFPWLNVEANVSFGLRMQGVPRSRQREKVAQYLDLVGLKDHATKFPAQLSGGMRQRVQIARGLAVDPRMLLMDEPFGALDALTRMRMQQQLLQIWENTHKTVIFVTHDIAEAIILADRIAVMSAGPAATIRETVPVHIQRPRDSADPQFGVLLRKLETMLLEETGDGEE